MGSGWCVDVLTYRKIGMFENNFHIENKYQIINLSDVHGSLPVTVQFLFILLINSVTMYICSINVFSFFMTLFTLSTMICENITCNLHSCCSNEEIIFNVENR